MFWKDGKGVVHVAQYNRSPHYTKGFGYVIVCSGNEPAESRVRPTGVPTCLMCVAKETRDKRRVQRS